MRVLVFDGPHRFRVEERPLPEPTAHEVRIRIARTGICGSDLHGYTGESGRRVAGMIMGHETSGWIEAMGPEVMGLELGDLVTFNPALACDGSCGHQAANRCSRLRVIGVTPDIQGSFADAIVVPSDRVLVVRDLSLEWAAGVEPMAVALQAARHLEVGAGNRALVVGGGMIGQCVAQALRAEGATEVVISDPLADRREVALQAGFRAVAPQQVEELEPFDRAVDAVGTSQTASATIRAVSKGGTICFLGLGLADVSIPLFDVVVGERRIVGSFAYTDEIFEEAARLLLDGALDLGKLIGPIVSFEETPQAFEDLATGARRDVKIMMSTGASAPRATSRSAAE